MSIGAQAEDHRSFTHLLTGVFAYSYSGYHAAAGSEMPAIVAPEIGSYLERTRPATSMVAPRGWELYDEIDGYELVDYVGWVDFHGDGTLSGGGTSQRAGAHAVPFAHAGTYVVENAQPPMHSEQTVTSSCVLLTHAHASEVVARTLRFTLLDADAGRLLASGTMMPD